MLFLKYFPFLCLLFPEEKFITITQGDRIHHTHHGIGEVQSIRKRSFSGENGTRFAKIFFKRDNLTLMLRENQLDENIREPMGKGEAKKLLDHLNSWTGKVSEQWKTRANANQLKMEAGEPMRYAEVFKSLKQRQAEDSLSQADRNHLKQSTELLSEELANAIGKTPEQALKELSRAVSS